MHVIRKMSFDVTVLLPSFSSRHHIPYFRSCLRVCNFHTVHFSALAELSLWRQKKEEERKARLAAGKEKVGKKGKKKGKKKLQRSQSICWFPMAAVLLVERSLIYSLTIVVCQWKGEGTLMIVWLFPLFPFHWSGWCRMEPCAVCIQWFVLSLSTFWQL